MCGYAVLRVPFIRSHAAMRVKLRSGECNKVIRVCSGHVPIPDIEDTLRIRVGVQVRVCSAAGSFYQVTG